MGYTLTRVQADAAFAEWLQRYKVYAPVLKKGEGCFSDTDIIRYDTPKTLEDIVWDKKSDYSFKEALIAINETLFYFTEDQTTIPKGPDRDIVIFLRPCDLNAVKRLDQIYLDNGPVDFYYARIRERAHFVLMGCTETCENGYCVSMGTNTADNYDAYLKVEEDAVYVDLKNPELGTLVAGAAPAEVTPDFVTENEKKVTLPKHLSNETFQNPIWQEYGARCIACGRCNFACPTCTCFTMQDIFYKDNAKVGERRRIWASCQVDGYDTIAGGIKFRKTQGDAFRFKVMHKIYDFEQRFGYTMCVGCGRCDDICPEYINHATVINRLAKEEEQS